MLPLEAFMSLKSCTPALLASLLLLSGCQEIGDLLFGLPTPQSGGFASSLSLQRLDSQAGQTDENEDRRIVSANYQVEIPAPGEQMPVIEIPVQKELLPEKLSGAAFQPEYQQAGSWVADGKLVDYDASAQVVRFVPGQAGASASALSIKQDAQTTRVYRIRVYFFYNHQTAEREGSKFRIHYYPSRLTNSSRVKTDSAWNSRTGHALDPKVPDFVEDLDYALNEVYTRILATKTSKGELFKAPELPVDVYVQDVGGDAGDSPLGGPMRISNHKITDYKDLKLTAAHELVHVLQGQYYNASGVFSGRQNRWFIEALANYLAAQANGLDDTGKKAFYGEFYSDYLSVSLTASNDNSMYAAAHFLDWLASHYGQSVISDALAESNGNDLVGLSKTVKTKGVNGGVGAAFEAYLKDILTQPEGTAGFHKAIISAMYSHAIGNHYLSSGLLNEKRTYNTLVKTLAPMSAVYSQQSANNAQDALMIADSQASKGDLMGSLSFSGSGATQRYDKQLDTYDQVPSLAPLAIKNVRQGQNSLLEQLIYNDGQISKASVDVKYLLLQKPEIRSWNSDEVSWSTSTLGNIPLGQVSYELLNGRNKVLTIKPRDKEASITVHRILPGQDYSQVPTSEMPRYYDENFTSKPNLVMRYKDLIWPEIASQVNVALSAIEGQEVNLGGQIHLKATVTGDANTAVTWKLDLTPYYKDYFTTRPPMGSLSTSGTEATWQAPSTVIAHETQVEVTVTSVADPSRSATITLTVNDPDDVCVPAGTQVTLADGRQQAIETLQPGQGIIAIDPQTRQKVEAKIEKLIVHQGQTYQLNAYRTDSGDELRLTPNHPVLMADGSWKGAEQLQIGDQIYQYQAASQRFELTKIIVIIRDQSRSGTVYNLKTTQGNYIANDLVVHNKCLAAGSLIETPAGLVPVEALRIGQKVYGMVAGHKLPVEVTHLYTKQTILDSLPGKRLGPELLVTANHLIYSGQGFVRAEKTNLPDQVIPGLVYDLNTSSGNYYGAGQQLMKSGS